MPDSDERVNGIFIYGPQRIRVEETVALPSGYKAEEREGFEKKEEYADAKIEWEAKGGKLLLHADYALLDRQFPVDGYPGVRDTQRKIEGVLRLDYDTFVNSAFLRQGRADEFTVKTPAERKRVLAEILGLDVWESYEERAKGRQRALQEEIRTLDLRLEEIEAELAHRSEYEAQLREAQAEVVELSGSLQELQAQWQEIEAARTSLRHVREQAAGLDERIGQARREREALAQERREREARLAELRELVAQAAEIEAGFAAYQAAQERERALGEKLTALTGLNERRARLEAEITEARHGLETRRDVLAQQVAELESRLASPELLQRHEEVKAEVAALIQLREGYERARADLARLTEERAARQAENKGLKPEMDALKERIDLLEQASANCPLCGQPLEDVDRLRLVEELKEQGKQKGDAYRANRARLKGIAAEVKALEEQIERDAKQIQGLAALEQEAATLAERVRAGEEAARGLASIRQQLGRLEAELEAGSYAAAAQQALAAVLAQAAELGYDAEAHAAARRAVTEGEVFAARKLHLDTARTGIEQEEAALARVEEADRRWREQEEADHARQAELERRVAGLEAQLVDAAAVEEELNRVRLAEAEARQRLGAAQQRLAACDSLAQQRESRGKRREELAHQESLYSELRAAFGVRGVPAMIIEAAVPEIEAEANRLLSRMTGGRMHVRLETQRETKTTKEVRETLDIRIMDELGERPYENYSGGEQYRVNFALRIALSRLLARRAGAQLETLIIDEGFGTQDAQGRERLVETIRAIQDEFARVLVITHIEEMRGAFPVQIEITKTPQGSEVVIL